MDPNGPFLARQGRTSNQWDSILWMKHVTVGQLRLQIAELATDASVSSSYSLLTSMWTVFVSSSSSLGHSSHSATSAAFSTHRQPAFSG